MSHPCTADLYEIFRLTYTDNVTTNDVAIKIVCQRLKPDIQQPEKRRIRCLGHIINPAAMAFLFGNNQASVEVETLDFGNTDYLDAQLNFWRKKGSKGKLYNLVYFIRKTPQRRERFFECYKVANAKKNNIKGECE
jgi:hypothetical protein